MKNLILLLLLAITATFGYAQQIPEKANTIVVTLADSNNVNEKVLKVLNDREYTINAGKTPSIISTAPRTLKNGARIAYSAQIKGAEIILTGKLPVAGQSSMNISYQGNKGTPIMNGWEEMDKIAKAFGGKVKYEKR